LHASDGRHEGGLIGVYDPPVEEPLSPAPLDDKLDRIVEMLQALADEEPEMRRRLRQLRESESEAYRAAFEVPEPLVSVITPTYRAFEALRDVSLPSALAQTHRNLEIVVVGDAAPPETAAVVESFGDARLRFENLSLRGPYPEDRGRAWLVTGTPPYNAAVALARGAWIAPLADDDAWAPDHVETLLAVARQRQLEFVYTRLRVHLPDGGETVVGEFPPRLGQFGLQGALYHSGLSFMELNLSDALYGVPNDWSLCRRMMRAGVRMGMVDEPMVDYHPTHDWGRAPKPMEQERERNALAAAESRADELERQLAAIASSRSWRLTRPLRAIGERIRGSRSASS
ncbi:MAG: hypothetical protein QOE60_979, partial [Thermoleophilaceae bacterium]|nr:hypothetical protein [Thermoleophilaceae bacterium]